MGNPAIGIRRPPAPAFYQLPKEAPQASHKVDRQVDRYLDSPQHNTSISLSHGKQIEPTTDSPLLVYVSRTHERRMYCWGHLGST